MIPIPFDRRGKVPSIPGCMARMKVAQRFKDGFEGPLKATWDNAGHLVLSDVCTGELVHPPSGICLELLCLVQRDMSPAAARQPHPEGSRGLGIALPPGGTPG